MVRPYVLSCMGSHNLAHDKEEKALKTDMVKKLFTMASRTVALHGGEAVMQIQVRAETIRGRSRGCKVPLWQHGPVARVLSIDTRTIKGGEETKVCTLEIRAGTLLKHFYKVHREEMQRGNNEH